MNLEFEQPKPTRYSAYKIDTKIGKFIGLKRSYSTYKDLQEKDFTTKEMKNLSAITKMLEKKLQSIRDENCLSFQIYCPICMYSYDEYESCPKVLRCGHTLCLDCLNQQFIQKECPMCRTVIIEDQLNLIPSIFILLEEIQKFKEQLTRNLGIHCEEHPDQEITFYEQNSNQLFCQKCINYKRRAYFKLNAKNMLTSQELYQRLHRFWKQNAKKAIKCQNILEYNRCKVFDQYISAKNDAIKKLEEKAQNLVEQINEIKVQKIEQVKLQCMEYQKEYQIYKFQKGKYEKYQMAKICKMNFSNEKAIESGKLDQFLFYCTELRYLFKRNLLKGQYCYQEFKGKHEKIDDIVKAKFELNENFQPNQDKEQ